MAPKSWDPPFDLQVSSKVVVKMANLTFDDPCRSKGGSYDFGAMETFVHRAKIYRYAEFHPNRTWAVFPQSPSHTPIMGPSVTSVGQTVAPTTSGLWRVLISMQRSISIPIFIKIT